jgi:lysophospholipase L1-like esterase
VTAPRSATAEARHARVLCLGDSYTIGEGVAPDDRWTAQLTRLLGDNGVDIESQTIVARTGWTTDELSLGIDAARPEGPFELVTLLIGVNDQYRGRSVTDFRPRFMELLRRAMEFAGGYAARVLVLSIPDWGVTPFAADRDGAAIAAEIDAFNDVARDEAARAGARFVDVTACSRQAAARTQVVADGLHPSATMYAAWAQVALPAALAALGHIPE